MEKKMENEVETRQQGVLSTMKASGPNKENQKGAKTSAAMI